MNLLSRKWSDIEFKAKTIRWCAEFQKNGEATETPLLPSTAAALTEYLQKTNTKNNGCVFERSNLNTPHSRDIFYTWWRQSGAALGLNITERTGFHSFRRNFASDLAGAPLAVLTKLGGWKDPEMVVKAYAKASLDQMRAVLDNRSAFSSGKLTSTPHTFLPVDQASEVDAPQGGMPVIT